MLKNFLFIAIFLVSFDSFSQIRKNSLYGELAGNALVYSLNYERNILSSEVVHFNARLGVSILYQSVGVPLEANVLFGKRKHFLETGIGPTIITGRSREMKSNGEYANGSVKVYTHATGRLGYRYQAERGFLFRIAFIPTLSRGNYYPWAGVSFGKSF